MGDDSPSAFSSMNLSDWLQSLIFSVHLWGTCLALFFLGVMGISIIGNHMTMIILNRELRKAWLENLQDAPFDSQIFQRRFSDQSSDERPCYPAKLVGPESLGIDCNPWKTSQVSVSICTIIWWVDDNNTHISDEGVAIMEIEWAEMRTYLCNCSCSGDADPALFQMTWWFSNSRRSKINQFETLRVPLPRPF